MDPNLDELARELSALTQRFADLGAKLGEAARALAETGAPPADRLVRDLAGARSQFIQLRTDVLTAAEAASVPPRGEPESLGELEPLLGAIGASLRLRGRQAGFEETRQRVVAILERVLEIVPVDEESFPILVGCQEQARSLYDSAMALTDPDSPEAHQLVAHAQSFADLLMILESRDALDDARYARLEESVSTAFGRALAVAVSGGRLAFGSDTAQAPPEPEAAQPVTRAAVTIPANAPPSLAAPPVEEPPLELEIAPPALPPEPVTVPVEPTVVMPTIELPSLADLPPVMEAPPEPVKPPSSFSSPKRSAPATAAPPARSAPPRPAADPAAPDETAQWWLAAWARWSGWKATHEFAGVAKEEIGKFPYLLSVPIQKSPEYEDGLLAYGYSILLDHVEKQRPGCVGNALNSLKPGVTQPVGEQLYDYLISEGRLRESYGEFVKNALVAAVPEPGLWFQFRILESKEDTRIFQRSSSRLGDSELSGQRLATDAQRYAEHKFKMMLGPLTLRCVQVAADSVRETRGVGVKITSDGAASDHGWIASVRAGAKSKTEARPVAAEGTHIVGLGKEYGALWVAVFNPDPMEDRRYELSVFLRKDTKSPFRAS
jgi:hypothetical protein